MTIDDLRIRGACPYHVLPLNYGLTKGDELAGAWILFTDSDGNLREKERSPSSKRKFVS